MIGKEKLNITGARPRARSAKLLRPSDKVEMCGGGEKALGISQMMTGLAFAFGTSYSFTRAR